MKHFYLLRSGAKALCLLALVALATTTAKAELLLNEDFDRTAGQLSAGKKVNRNNDLTNWWSLASWTEDTPTNPIQVAAGSLSYTDYSTGNGNKAQLSSVNGTCDARYFSETTSGTLFLSAVINVASVGTSQDYFFGFCDGSTNYYGRVYAVADGTSGYKLSVAKSSELKTDITYSSTCKFNENVLIVVEYEFVEDAKNDKVNLYINPTKEKPTTATIAYNSTLSDAKPDPSKLAAVYMRQRTSTPAVAIDEIKVATAWTDLFPASSGEGDGGETTKTPEITSSESLLFGGNAFLDETYTATFTVSGKNLKGDITLESDNSEVTLSHNTIAQTDAEAEGGVTVTATLKPATTGAKGSAGITLKSDGASDVVVAASWAVVERTKVATIAELKEAEKTASTSDYLFFTGEAVVTYAEKPSSTQFYYIEDATGAVRLDEINAVAIESGDRIKDFTIAINEDQSHSFYISTDPTIVSKNNELTPQVVTLETLSNNGADYFWELVKVEGVTLDKTDAQYIAGQNKISQDETTINLNLTSDNTLVGTDKPTKADVVGISYYDTGLVIRARSAADITAKPEGTTTAIATAQNGEMLCYSVDGMLHIDNATSNVAIYSLTGICVARLNAAEHIAISLPQGIYAVKANGATTKVVVK